MSRNDKYNSGFQERKNLKILRNKLSKIYRFCKRQFYTKLGTDKDLILIYTMSKVGSSSVYHSLKEKYPYKEIHHIHFLGPTWLDSFKSGHSIFKNNLKHADMMFKLLKKRKWNIKIISLTRDPIARDISGIFQTWQHIFEEVDIEKVSPEKIISYLNTQDFNYAENWFATDFREFTKLDVFKHKFNSDKGYEIYLNEGPEILIMQLEQLNSVYNKAMNAFLGPGEYKLKKENITSSRASGELNAKVKRMARFPEKKLHDIYTSKYMSTFYNKSQLDKFKSRWIEK